MLHSAPTTISSSSARSTEPYQILAARPSVTRPTTTAPGAIQASGWTCGTWPPTDPIQLLITTSGCSLRLSGSPKQSGQNGILVRFGCARGAYGRESCPSVPLYQDLPASNPLPHR